MRKFAAAVVAVGAGFFALSGGTAQAAFLPTDQSPSYDSETFVESRSGGKNFAAYLETTVFPDGWSNSTAKSSAPGTTAGIGSRFNTTNAFGGAFQVSPTLPTAGAEYDVWVTITSASGDITASTAVSATGGTGLPASTAAFGTPGNEWHYVGLINLDDGVTTPVVTFTEITHSNRMYADAIAFGQVPVPEPTSVALFGLAGVGVLSRRRRV